MRFLIIFFFLCHKTVLGINGPVTPLRACLNNNDSIITLDWVNPTDACGSFSRHRIYARENANPFVPIADINSLAVNSFQFKLPNLNPGWQFYWVTLYACNMTDSFTSAIISIDLSKPPSIELDSVSINTNQVLEVGWPKNAAGDVKGYRLYQYNSGINDSIADTSALYYSFYNQNNINRFITLSAYDSCNLYSPISLPHKPVILTTFIDTCANLITLNWAAYQGWTVGGYDLYLKKNKNDYMLINTGITSLSSVYSSFILGDSMCFYIRANQQGKSVTSSSNISCIYTRAKTIPSKNYINQVTVIANKHLDVSWVGENIGDVNKTELNRSVNGGSFSPIKSYTNTPAFTFSDLLARVDLDKINYQVLLTDVCGDTLGLSNISGNILLSLANNQVNWNNYVGWAGTVDRYELVASESSTWNNSYPNPTTYTLSKEDIANAKTCFTVTAFETNNPFSQNKSSTSNTVCYEGPFTYYVPNAIVPTGNNNKFTVVGVNIDTIQSYYIIFNRWGEVLYRSNRITDEWFGTYKGEPVQAGIYFYLIDIYSNRGERAQKKGEIRIIK